MKVAYNQKTDKNIQRFYYLGDFSAPTPVEEVNLSVAKLIAPSTLNFGENFIIKNSIVKFI